MQWHGDFLQVRDLDAHGILAGNRREDVDALCAGGAGEVCFQLRNARNPQSRRRIDFVAGDRGPTGDVAGRHFDAEGLQGIDDRTLGGQQLLAVGFRSLDGFVDVQQIEARQFVVLEARDGKELVTARLLALEGFAAHHLRVVRPPLRGVDDLRRGNVAQWQHDLWLVRHSLDASGLGGIAVLAPLLALAVAFGLHLRFARGHFAGSAAAGLPRLKMLPRQLKARLGESHRLLAGEQDHRDQISTAGENQRARAADQTR